MERSQLPPVDIDPNHMQRAERGLSCARALHNRSRTRIERCTFLIACTSKKRLGLAGSAATLKSNKAGRHVLSGVRQVTVLATVLATAGKDPLSLSR